MAQLVVYAQKDHKIILNENSNKVYLNQASIVQIAVGRDDIDSMIRDGNKLVITLKNGEKIIIDNYFTNVSDENLLILSRGNAEYYQANFDSSGQFQSYTDLKVAHSTESLPQLTPPQAEKTADDGLFSKSSLIKLGLAAVAVEGIYLAAFDSNSSSSSAKVTTVPTLTSAAINTDGTQVSGTAEANSTVYVSDLQGNVLGTSVADAKGAYSVTLSKAVTDNNYAAIYVKDTSGNTSKVSYVQGTKDTIAPNAPVAQASDDGTIVAGTAEKGSTIYVKDANGVVLGQGVATNGQYSIKLSSALSSGTTANVTAVDAAGNVSKATVVEPGKDTVPPAQPQLLVSTDGTNVSGTGEANASIQILDASGNIIATSTVDASGKFNITLATALTGTASDQIVLIDAAGNKSTAISFKAGTDLMAPVAPSATINVEGTTVTGSAEANSTVIVSDRSGNSLGSTTADASGNYSITLSKAVTDDAVANVTATDKSGNISSATTVVGTKDTLAPDIPALPSVTDDTGTTPATISNGGTTDDAKPTFTGSGAEAGTTLTVYMDSKPVASVLVANDKTWSWTPTSDLAIGSHNFTFSLSDVSGNTSAQSSSFTFTITAPVKATAASLSNVLLSADTAQPAETSDTTASTVNTSDLLQSSSTDHTVDNVIASTSNTATTSATSGSSATSTSLDAATAVTNSSLDQLLQTNTQTI